MWSDVTEAAITHNIPLNIYQRLSEITWWPWPLTFDLETGEHYFPRGGNVPVNFGVSRTFRSRHSLSANTCHVTLWSWPWTLKVMALVGDTGLRLLHLSTKFEVLITFPFGQCDALPVLVDLSLPMNIQMKIAMKSFLRASAMLKHVIDIGWTSVRLSVRPSVCPSVRLSHAGTLSKRLNILSWFLHHTIAHSF